MPRRRQTILAVCLVSLATAGVPLRAGTISVRWDPVVDPDLAGYRLYYGNSPGVYGQAVDVGAATEHTLAGLTDCSMYYLALKSVDVDGVESAQFSDEISGYTSPSLASVSPAAVLVGSTFTLALDGMSFENGASLTFSRPGLTLNSVDVLSCSQAEASLSVSAAMAPGPVDVSIVNPGNVPAVLVAGLTVAADLQPSDVDNLHRTDTSPSP